MNTDSGRQERGTYYEQRIALALARANAAASGAGAGVTIQTPATVVVDPINGNDATPAGPFKTVKRTNAYLRNASLRGTGVLSISVASSPPPTDDFFAPVGWQNLEGASIVVRGTPTIVHTGTLSAVTAGNPPTNTREKLTDAAIASWAPFIAVNSAGNLVRDLTTGASTWLPLAVPALPADQTYTGQPVTDAGAFSSMGAGHPYQIESRVTLAVGVINLLVNAPTAPLNAIIFEDLNIAGFPFIIDNGAFSLFLRCNFTTALGFNADTPVTCTNCAFTFAGGAFFGEGQLVVNFGVLVAQADEFSGPFDAIVLELLGNVYVTGLGLFATGTTSLIVINSGGTPGSGAQFQDCQTALAALGGPFTSVGATLWGNGNVGAGVAVAADETAVVATDAANTTNVTGAGGDFVMISTLAVGVVATAFPFDVAAHAYDAAIACSWANLHAATPAGFGGGAHRPESNAHLLGIG